MMRNNISRGALLAATAAALLAGGSSCGRSNDVSGHNTYMSQTAGTEAAAKIARDTAADTAAPRVKP
jgi:hypothetical protein